jgi:hypothetical protein
MPIRAKTLQVAALCCATLLPSGLRAEGIDTEHIFAFMIGADVGTFGEREFQSQTTGRFGRNGGTNRSLGQELELELVPFRNFRVEVGGEFAAHDISGVPGLEDRRQLTLQGGSLDLRYQFLNRDSAPFGLTVAVGGTLEPHRRNQRGEGAQFRHLGHACARPRIDSQFSHCGAQPGLSAGMDALSGNRRRRAGLHRRPGVRRVGAGASGHLARRRGALFPAI